MQLSVTFFDPPAVSTATVPATPTVKAEITPGKFALSLGVTALALLNGNMLASTLPSEDERAARWVLVDDCSKRRREVTRKHFVDIDAVFIAP